jgi:N-methylhydantoinase A/oxoprolinase/acetone carboxylase beta subunit
MSLETTPRILAIDAGGTMTDTFIINEKGDFIVGKAQTTPEDESEGFMNSSRDALAYWDMTVEEAFPSLVTGIYSGTSMLNRLLERKGRKVGVIVTKGMEDYFRLERGQSYRCSYSTFMSAHQPVGLVPTTMRRARASTFSGATVPIDDDAARRRSRSFDEASSAVRRRVLLPNPAHEPR